MAKKFDPNKCPYKQLRNHKGIASVLIESRSNDNNYRFRAVSSHRKDMVGSHSFWNGSTTLQSTLKGGIDHRMYRSCFEYDRMNYQRVISAMKRHDNSMGLKITFIIFH